jgi:hypothetical protein
LPDSREDLGQRLDDSDDLLDRNADSREKIGDDPALL